MEMTVKALKKNNMAFKMKGSPMARNFGISPLKADLKKTKELSEEEKIELEKVKQRALDQAVSSLDELPSNNTDEGE